MKTFALNERARVVIRGHELFLRQGGEDCLIAPVTNPDGLSNIFGYIWGFWWWQHKPCTVKILEVNPGQRLSDQRHAHRAESWWVLTKGVQIDVEEDMLKRTWQPFVCEKIHIPIGRWHRLACIPDSPRPCRVLEISSGHFDEQDIERRSDDYGRLG
ncbi:hypothetical protein HZA86_00840 [Candidatus Uhrbacteria bacterium]|nr:hypothetical protein [Candidatus Uhrbacteria bacterium]